MLDIFPPHPDEFNRLMDLFGDLDHLRDAVNIETPAKAVAQQVIMDCNFSSGRLVTAAAGARDLCPDSDRASIPADMDDAILRLHGGMYQKRELIDGFDHFSLAF